MKTDSPVFALRHPRASLSLIIVAGALWLAPSSLAAADDSVTNAAPKAADVKPDAPPPPRPEHKLTGVELYAIHCNRCHPERYPVEWNQGEWKTLMLHMRVRANLPAAQAREILKYLQEESGQ